MSVGLMGEKYNQEGARAGFHQQLLHRLEGLPGGKGVATVDLLPLLGGRSNRFYVAGNPVPPPGEETGANVRTVSASYFHVMEVPVLQGRHFSDQDRLSTPRVIIVNQTLDRRLFPNGHAIGARLIISGDEGKPCEIVGVVGDERVNGLTVETTPVVYFPYLQEPGYDAVVLMRTLGDPMKLVASVRHASFALEPSLVVYFTRTMENIILNLPATFIRRYPALLLALFAGIALLLAAIGTYGVMSYTVTQRTREVGIRMALGAQASDVCRLVIGQGIRLVLTGVGIGLLASLALTRFLAGLLFGVSSTDPTTFVLVAFVLSMVALLACYLPARRATKVDPMVALRCE